MEKNEEREEGIFEDYKKTPASSRIEKKKVKKE